MPISPDWSLNTFEELNTRELYEIARLRIDVFVVEQACVYPELDGLDLLADTLHCQGIHEDRLIAYARILGLPRDQRTVQSSDPIRIGRVLTHHGYRGQGLARQMMLQLLTHANAVAPDRSIKLSAQTNVVGFYESLGFNIVSEEYVEDGIPHIDMELVKNDS